MCKGKSINDNLKPLTESKLYDIYRNDRTNSENWIKPVYEAIDFILDKVELAKLYVSEDEDFICINNENDDLKIVLHIPEPQKTLAYIPRSVIGVSDIIDGVFRFSVFTKKVICKEPSLISTNYLFMNYPNETLDVSELNTTNVTSMIDMFKSAKRLKELKLGSKVFNTSKVTTVKSLLCDCVSLEKLTLTENIVTNNLQCTDYMFGNCKSLTYMDLGENFTSESLVSLNGMFSCCDALETLKVSSKFDLTNIKEGNDLIVSCYYLKHLYVDDFDVLSLTSKMSKGTKRKKKVNNISLDSASLSWLKAYEQCEYFNRSIERLFS